MLSVYLFVLYVYTYTGTSNNAKENIIPSSKGVKCIIMKDFLTKALQFSLIVKNV